MNRKELIVISRIVTLICIMVSLSCIKKEPVSADLTGISVDSALGLIIADTITYEVVISNEDPENTWAEECLRHMNHKVLVDNIFNMIHNGMASAYNFQTMERLTDKQLEKIESEPGYSRSEIGMIQFTEIWYLNPEKGDFTKKVHAMVLGYNFYTSDGTLFGHTPLFRVEL